MRALLVLAAAVAATVPGCIGVESSTTETTETRSWSFSGTSLQPVDVQLRHDYREPEAVLSFEIPRNATVTNYDAYFEALAPVEGFPLGACAVQDATMTIRNPSGHVYDLLTANGYSVQSASPRSCGSAHHRSNWPGVPLAAGTWTVSFEGQGVAVGVVNFTG